MNIIHLRSLVAAALMTVGVVTATMLLVVGVSTAQTSNTPPTCFLTTTSAALAPGTATEITWNTTDADTFFVDNNIGTTTSVASGTFTVTPTTTTTYQGFANGAGGTSSCEVTIQVLDSDTATTTDTTTTVPPFTPLATTSIQLQQTSTTTQDTTTTSTSLDSMVDSISQLLNTPAVLNSAPSYPAAGSTPAPMIFDVDSNGHVLIRGTVEVVDPNVITISSWGGLWTLRTNSVSTVIPEGPGGAGDMSTIQVGDFVGAEGFIAADLSFTIDAELVRNWTTNPYQGSGSATNAVGTTDTNNSSTENETQSSNDTTGQSTTDQTNAVTTPDNADGIVNNNNDTVMDTTEDTTEDEPGFFDSVF